MHSVMLLCCCWCALLLAQGWKLDAAQFPAVAAYMEKLKGMPAWQHTLPADGDAAVVAGWVKHMSS
jgi:hypothetical protein